jgi:hypothetical protein
MAAARPAWCSHHPPRPPQPAAVSRPWLCRARRHPCDTGAAPPPRAPAGALPWPRHPAGRRSGRARSPRTPGNRRAAAGVCARKAPGTRHTSRPPWIRRQRDPETFRVTPPLDCTLTWRTCCWSGRNKKWGAGGARRVGTGAGQLLGSAAVPGIAPGTSAYMPTNPRENPGAPRHSRGDVVQSGSSSVDGNERHAGQRRPARCPECDGRALQGVDCQGQPGRWAHSRVVRGCCWVLHQLAHPHARRPPQTTPASTAPAQAAPGTRCRPAGSRTPSAAAARRLTAALAGRPPSPAAAGDPRSSHPLRRGTPTAAPSWFARPPYRAPRQPCPSAPA